MWRWVINWKSIKRVKGPQQFVRRPVPLTDTPGGSVLPLGSWENRSLKLTAAPAPL